MLRSKHGTHYRVTNKFADIKKCSNILIATTSQPIRRAACRLTAEEDADLAEDEDEIARGDLASEDEVNAMWKKHGR
jgi:hypothetical protein